MSSASQVPAPEGAGLSQVERVIDTFIAPSKTFTDIKRSASWWMPWLLMAIFSYGLSYTVSQKVGWEQVNENQLRLQPKRAAQVENLPADQRERQMAIGAKVTQGIAFAFPILILVVSAIIALIMMASLNFGAGAQVTFMRSMAVVIYASLPSIVKSLLAIITLWAGASPEGFTFQNPVATNPSSLFTPGTPMYSLATSCDIIAIWTLILSGLGFSCISALKRSTTTGIVFGWYILVTLIGAGFTALMS
jgi:hypothetical protein